MGCLCVGESGGQVDDIQCIDSAITITTTMNI